MKRSLLFVLAILAVSLPALGQVGGGVYNPRDTLTTIPGILAPQKGGTGNANATTLTWSGFPLTFGLTGSTTVFLPTSGTLATLGVNTFTGLQTINLSATALPAPVLGTILHTGQVDTTPNTITMDTFSGAGVIAFRRAGGTAASPSGLASGTAMGVIGGYGRGATGYSSGSRAQIAFISAEPGTWTDSAQGANIIMQTAPVGTTATAEAFRVTSAGVATTSHYRSTAPNTQTGATYTVLDTDNYIIANGAGTLTLTLPTAATYTGRALTVKTTVAQTVVSATANVVPRAGGAAGTAILAAAAGNWATLVSNGTSWVNMSGTP